MGCECKTARAKIRGQRVKSPIKRPKTLVKGAPATKRWMAYLRSLKKDKRIKNKTKDK